MPLSPEVLAGEELVSSAGVFSTTWAVSAPICFTTVEIFEQDTNSVLKSDCAC